jgi:hypothetical protein
VKQVIKADADLSVHFHNSHTALHLAALEGHLGALMILEELASLDLLNKTSKAGKTAYDYADFSSHYEAALFLKVTMTQKADIQIGYKNQAEELTAYYTSIKTDEPLSVEEYKDVVYSILINTEIILPEFEAN